mgnify:CR=1 FL=1
MPRQRMQPGEFGRITTAPVGRDLFEARTYVRDDDGVRRKVRRTGKSAEDAERNLKRHLRERTAPMGDRRVNETTTLAELFDTWIAVKVAEDGLKPQSVTIYRQAWTAYGVEQVGALRVRELRTDKADAVLKAVPARSGAVTLRKVLRGMYALAVRFGVVAVNPIDGARPSSASKKVPVRAVTPDEYVQVVEAVVAYTSAVVSGPPRGRYLLALVELLAATGGRINEVLALAWEDVDLLAKVPTLTITGHLLDYGSVKGSKPHREDGRKNDGAALTVMLPRRAVEVLTELFGVTGPSGLVFKNRDGEPMSAHNMRRSLRAALPEELAWVTPKSFRATAGTVVRDHLGVEAAQQQLGHARLATTEGHYVERVMVAPDARAAFDAL